MLNCGFNWIGDLQWGSTGKGLAAAYLSYAERIENVSTTNLPNAGHTAVVDKYLDSDLIPKDENEANKEIRFVSKIIPTSAILHRINQDKPGTVWTDQGRRPPKIPTCWIGAGAGFYIDRLLQEVEECGLKPGDLNIHPRAVVVTDKDKNQEASGENSTKHLASTMQGSAAAVVRKMMRGKDVKLACHYEELKPYICENFSEEVLKRLDNPSMRWLHEGSQGFSLGINFGSHYPYCTSRECTVMQSMADMGVPPKYVGDIIGVMRPYPIRVGNVVEDGKQVGYSGDCYPDHKEISWEEVQRRAGYPNSWNDGKGLSELTTVTKRQRRVFEYSPQQIKEAVAVNGVNKIFLNFANYLDFKVYKKNKADDLTDPVWAFIAKLERLTPAKVCWVGTGPNINDVIEL